MLMSLQETTKAMMPKLRFFGKDRDDDQAKQGLV
jgi:hypothetical protein